MFIKNLKILKEGVIIRDIPFHKGYVLSSEDRAIKNLKKSPAKKLLSEGRN